MKRRVWIALAVVLAFAVTASVVWATTVGLVSYWPFDEGSGTMAYDAANGNDGTIYGATYTADKAPVVGNSWALSFDGQNDYVNIADDDSLDITGDITLAAWIKINAYSTSEGWHMYVVSKDAAGQRSYGIAVDLGYYPYPVGTPGFIVFRGGSYEVVWGTSALSLNTWYHLAGVFDATTGGLELYVDGALQSTEPSAFHSINAGTADLRIGARQYTGHQCFFNGIIDEVGIWNRALDEAEIAALAARALEVDIDIKPGSDPNCFNNDGHGVIPVAILGSADFCVTDIDSATVALQGMAVKAVGKSNKLLARIEDVNGDGFDDLVVKIEDTDATFTSGSGTATLTGQLWSGTPFEGSDSICVVP